MRAGEIQLDDSFDALIRVTRTRLRSTVHGVTRDEAAAASRSRMRSSGSSTTRRTASSWATTSATTSPRSTPVTSVTGARGC